MYYLIWIVILIILIIFLSKPVQWVSPRAFWYINKIKGPRGLPFIGVGLELFFLKPEQLIAYITDLFTKYPREFAIWILWTPTVILQEPEDVEIVFGGMTNISKGLEYLSLKPWLKEGLLTSTGKKWHTRRKILTPSFHFQILDDSLQSMNRNAAIFTEKLLAVQGETIDIEHYSKMCTLDVICESIMGVTIGAQKDEHKEYVNAIKRISEIVIQRVMTFWLHYDVIFHLSPVGFEFRRILKLLHNFSDKVIAERRRSYMLLPSGVETNVLNKKVRRAFLDTLIEYEINNPNSLSKYDIREEVDTFMFEGHDTTASAVTHILFLLAIHQNSQERVVNELYDIFGESDRAADMKDLSKMSYLDKVIKESLRLCPSVPYISRSLTTDITLKDDTVVPAGTNLVVLPYVLHRNPKSFPDPEKFDPERFTEGENEQRHPFSYIPFSAGPRNCIGQKFALMELKIIISTLLRKAELHPVTDISDIKPMVLLILRPNIPIRIKVFPRKKNWFP